MSLQEGQTNSYAVSILNGEAVHTGQLTVDPGINYAVLTIYSLYGGNLAYVGILQKDAPTEVSYVDTEIVGSWTGSAIRTDANFTVTDTSASNMTVTDTTDGIFMNGTDGDGTFSEEMSGITLSDAVAGVYFSSDVIWPDIDPTFGYTAIYAMSPDKKALAAAFLHNDCDYTLFDMAPLEKFAVWRKQ